MTKPTVYVETTIPSYLTGRPSRDLIQAARQQITREWWDGRAKYDLYVSQVVRREAGGGDEQAAAKRIHAIEALPLLNLTPAARELARRLVQEGPLPEKATLDALHIALATVHEMDYLLTWNVRHLTNATIRNQASVICRSSGYKMASSARPKSW